MASRLARDVLNQAGARAVILLGGINDIGDRSAKAETLIRWISKSSWHVMTRD